MTQSKSAKAKAKKNAKSTPEVAPKYELHFVEEALVEWEALDGSVKEPLRKALKKRLIAPHVPGSALVNELRGCYKIKLLKQGYRLVYAVEDDMLIVMVMSVAKRENSEAYVLAKKRYDALKAKRENKRS